MPVQGEGLTVHFLVWDTDENVGKTGDAGNLTMRVIKDGSAAAAANSPGEVENGLYKIVLSADEMDGSLVTVEGTSSTENVIVVPTHVATQDLADALETAHGVGRWNQGGRIIITGPSNEITVEGDGSVVDGAGNIIVTRDDPSDIQFTWTDQDITDYTIYLTVREDLYSSATDDTDAIFQVTADLTDEGNGIFTFTISKTETDKCALEKEYWYDISPFDADGKQEPTLLKARFTVSGDVTRRTSVA